MFYFMQTIKRVVCYAIAILFVILTFSACGSGSSRDVEGEWVLTNASRSHGLGSSFDFLSDGSTTWRSWGEEDWDEYFAGWSVEGRYIIFSYYYYGSEWEAKYVFERDGDILTLRYYTDSESYLVYTRPHAVQIESTAIEDKLDKMIISLLSDIGWIAPTTVRVLDAARLDLNLREDENPFRLPSTTIVLTVQSQNRGGGLTTTIVTSRLSFGGEYAWSVADSFPSFPRYRTDLDVARLNSVIVGHWESLGVN